MGGREHGFRVQSVPGSGVPLDTYQSGQPRPGGAPLDTYYPGGAGAPAVARRHNHRARHGPSNTQTLLARLMESRGPASTKANSKTSSSSDSSSGHHRGVAAALLVASLAAANFMTM